MTKKDMIKCYKDLSTCDVDKVEHVVGAIYQAFDTDNDGKVGMYQQDAWFSFYSIVVLDFKEFVIGFLLTTKGSIEEKLDYTFQIYGKHIPCIRSWEGEFVRLDVDKNGYIDQSEIDIMAKVRFFPLKDISIEHLFDLIIVRLTNARWKWKWIWIGRIVETFY